MRQDILRVAETYGAYQGTVTMDRAAAKAVIERKAAEFKERYPSAENFEIYETNDCIILTYQWYGLNVYPLKFKEEHHEQKEEAATD